MNKSEHDYNMLDWWKKVMFNNYANFSGRARRAEYWYFKLFQAIIFIPLYIMMIVGIVSSLAFGALFGILFVLFFLGSVIPSLAVTARRLHDVNKSGWTYLLAFIPFGALVILYYSVLEGDRGRNDYGEDPKMPVGHNEISQIGME